MNHVNKYEHCVSTYICMHFHHNIIKRNTELKICVICHLMYCLQIDMCNTFNSSNNFDCCATYFITDNVLCNTILLNVVSHIS